MSGTDRQAYSKALVARGDINFWIDEEILKPETWYADSLSYTGKREAPFIYSNDCMALPTRLIGRIERPGLSPVRELVMHKVHRPNFVLPLWRWWRNAKLYDDSPALWRL